MTQFLPPTTSMIHFYKKHVSTDKTERQSFRFDALKNYFTGPDDPNYCVVIASVFINDDESGLHHDYDVWLEKLAPHAPVSQYRHNVGEDNADAHMKRQIMGREVVVAVTDGRPDFGTWERIFYGEFDGRRKKRVLVKIIGE